MRKRLQWMLLALLIAAVLDSTYVIVGRNGSMPADSSTQQFLH
jgi:hypothetical protein